jgi:hypothetical protein
VAGNFEIVDREYIHPNIAGSMYGGKPFLLARTVTHILVWIPGYTSYISRGSGNQYANAQMIAHRRSETGYRGIQKICRGGRLKSALVNPEVRSKVDAIFGESFHSLLEHDKTVVLGDNGPWRGHEDNSRFKLGYDRG